MKKNSTRSFIRIIVYPHFSSELLLANTDQDNNIEHFNHKRDDTPIGVRAAYKINKHIASELSHVDNGETGTTFLDFFVIRLISALPLPRRI